MAEIDKVREKQGKTEDKEERERLRLYDEYVRGVETINTLLAPTRRYHSELEDLKENTIQYIKEKGNHLLENPQTYYSEKK